MDTRAAVVSRIEVLPPIPIPRKTRQSVDWRESAALNPVRDQGNCVCCCAFVFVTLLESVRKITFSKENLKRLSPQYLLQCVCLDPVVNVIETRYVDEKTGCYTYSINKTFEWLKQNPVQTEEDCPYLGRMILNFSPKLEPIDSLKIDHYDTLKGSEREKILMAVADHPVGAVMDFTPELKALRDGIYEGPLTVSLDDYPKHAVVIIGYGMDEVSGKNFWLIQSSWGRRKMGS